MNNLTAYLFFFLAFSFSRQQSPDLQTISIEKDDDFSGFELLNPGDNQVFVLAEHWHNIRRVPRATMKMLKYLYEEANVRILAIEQGNSAAYMINNYLSTGDTTVLRQISRNTMFWGKENYTFFQDLFEFNKTLPMDDKVSVQSIDIEYKMESAIFVINKLIGSKKIPESLNLTLGVFRQLFEDTKEHREQYNGLAVMYYYDREFVTELIKYTLSDLDNQSAVYENILGNDFAQFSIMIKDMNDGLIFDYTNPNTNYKFRDRLIYGKFNDLINTWPKTGILCVIGERHTTKGSSIFKLDNETDSPVFDKVLNIRISALYNKAFKTPDLRKIHFNYPQLLKKHGATLIRHTSDDPVLRSSRPFDYTLFINNGESLTPFNNILKEGY